MSAKSVAKSGGVHGIGFAGLGGICQNQNPWIYRIWKRRLSVRKYLALLVAFIAFAAACSSNDEPRPAPQPTAVPATDTVVSATATATVAASPTPTAVAPTADSIVLTISVAELAADIPGYDRDDWRHWTDADGDCQNARHETLIEESRIPVAFKDERRCQVASGEWVGPYTGTLVTEASDLDIDHMVPLANAHRSGGWQWPDDRKERYANYLGYPGHLVAATQRANRAKGADGPEAWRPDDRGYWCQYALDWIEIKRSWDLTVTPDEAEALREMVESCEMQVFIQAKRVEPASPEGSVSAPTPTAVPATATPSPTITPLPFEDYNCSDFDTWQEAQDFFLSEGGPENDPHNLDRNSDGMVCESLPGAPGSASEPTAVPIATTTAAPEPTLTPTAAAAPTMMPTPTFTATPAPTMTPAPTSTATAVPTAIATPTTTPSPTSTTTPLPTMTPAPPFEDRNCSDFDTWQEAQDFFLSEGGPEEDPHRLDRNRDGVACESLPGAP